MDETGRLTFGADRASHPIIHIAAEIEMPAFQSQEPYRRTCSVPASRATSAPSWPSAGDQDDRTDLPVSLAGEPIDIVAYDGKGDYAISLAQTMEVAAGSEATPFSDLSTLVGEVLAQAGTRPIRQLRIVAHGSSGVLYLGQGPDTRTVDRYQLGDYLPALAPLAGHFAPDGHVEFDSCNLAQYEGGEQFISELSQLWGVPVTAARQAQLAAFPGLEGSTVTASPDEEGGVELSEDDSPWTDWLLQKSERVHQWLFSQDP